MSDATMTRTSQILRVMSILAWVAFVGYLIEGGAILTSYAVSVINPEGAANLYRGLDLKSLREYNSWSYTEIVSFLVALALLKAWVSLLVIKTLSAFNLKNPFTTAVAAKLEKISHVAFGTWVVAMLYNAQLGWLSKRTGEQFAPWISGEFIFMVGLVFIIAQVFKRGVEIQTENELTV